MFIPSPWREKYLFTRQVEVQIEKSTLIILNTKTIDANFGGKENTFPSISSLIGYVLSIFRRKKYEPIPSKMDIKKPNPAPTH